MHPHIEQGIDELGNPDQPGAVRWGADRALPGICGAFGGARFKGAPRADW